MDGQAVLERNAVHIHKGDIELRFCIGLPAIKRTVSAQQAMIMLLEVLAILAEKGLKTLKTDISRMQHHIDSVENQQVLRAQQLAHKLVAFIADGSCLPCCSGTDDRPLSNTILCYAPAS